MTTQVKTDVIEETIESIHSKAKEMATKENIIQEIIETQEQEIERLQKENEELLKENEEFRNKNEVLKGNVAKYAERLRGCTELTKDIKIVMTMKAETIEARKKVETMEHELASKLGIVEQQKRQVLSMEKALKKEKEVYKTLTGELLKSQRWDGTPIFVPGYAKGKKPKTPLYILNKEEPKSMFDNLKAKKEAAFKIEKDEKQAELKLKMEKAERECRNARELKENCEILRELYLSETMKLQNRNKTYEDVVEQQKALALMREKAVAEHNAALEMKQAYDEKMSKVEEAESLLVTYASEINECRNLLAKLNLQKTKANEEYCEIKRKLSEEKYQERKRNETKSTGWFL